MLITWLINSYLAFCFLLFAMTTLLQLGVCPLWLRKAETTFKLFYLIYCTHSDGNDVFCRQTSGAQLKFEIHIFLKKKTFNVRVTGWDERVHIWRHLWWTCFTQTEQWFWDCWTPYKRLDLLSLFTCWKEKISHVRKCFAWCLLALLFCITWIP